MNYVNKITLKVIRVFHKDINNKGGFRHEISLNIGFRLWITLLIKWITKRIQIIAVEYYVNLW